LCEDLWDRGFFVITPLESQIQLVEKILSHWREGPGSVYNPTRKESFPSFRLPEPLKRRIEPSLISGRKSKEGGYRASLIQSIGFEFFENYWKIAVLPISSFLVRDGG
jgi:hypothetical protein